MSVGVAVLKIAMCCGLLGVAYVEERVNYRGNGVFRRVRTAKAREKSRADLKTSLDTIQKTFTPTPAKIPPAYISPKSILKPSLLSPYHGLGLWR